MPKPEESIGGGRAAPTSRRQRKMRVAVALLGTCLGLLVAEIGLRVLGGASNPYRAPEGSIRALHDLGEAAVNRYVPAVAPRVTLELHPDTKVLPGVSPAVHFKTDEFGFREEEPLSVHKAPGEKRIFAVGGSTTECLYLDSDDTWTALLEQGLRRVSATVRVVNSGRSGATTRDHIALLAQRIVPLQPDIVLFLVGINDLGLLTRGGYDITRTDDASRIEYHVPGLFESAKLALADRSHVFRLLVNSWRALQSSDARGNPVQDSNGLWVERARRKRQEAAPLDLQVSALDTTEFEQNLRTLVGTCRAHGALPVFLTQPVLWGADDPQAEQRMWVTIDGRRVDHRVMHEAMEKFNQVTRRVAAEFDVTLVDLARALPKTTEIFYDDDHFTVRGAQDVEGLVEAQMLADPRVLEKLR